MSDAEAYKQWVKSMFPCGSEPPTPWQAWLAALEFERLNSIPRTSLPKLPEGWSGPFEADDTGFYSQNK
ncbi:MAG TPA: hypothetical protein PLN21_09370 [Gemmatales bacterium]|nr:hypothetical protein [Gemmatales bacterium]